MNYDPVKEEGYWRRQRRAEVRAVIERKARVFTPEQRREERREELNAGFDEKEPG